MTVSLTLGGRFGRLAFGLGCIVLAGCASLAPNPELAVRQRATEIWQAKQASDYDKAYTFMPPSYRAVKTLADYKKNFQGAVQLTGAEVDRVVCETADKCVATMKLQAKPVLQRSRAAPPIVTYYEEVWVRENGQWWLFPTP